MKEGRDYSLVFHINERYAELKNEISSIHTLEEFSSSGAVRKAVLFDFLQIGELLNHLSEEFVLGFGKSEIDKVIAIRNRIVHGYGGVKDEIIFRSLMFELYPFIERINNYARERYFSHLKSLIGQNINVTIDSYNKLDAIIDDCSIIYGYTSALTNLVGTFQDVIVLSKNKFDSFFSGVVEAILFDKNLKSCIAVVCEEKHDDVYGKLVSFLKTANNIEYEIVK